MIRKATVEDLDVLTILFDEYMVFYKKPSDFVRHRAFLKDRLELGEADIFVALDDTLIIAGFALTYITFSSIRLGKILILNDLFVRSKVRNQKIGSQLIAIVADFAKEIGADMVRLRTAKSNLVAQGLYKKCGFVTDEVFLTCDLIL